MKRYDLGYRYDGSERPSSVSMPIVYWLFLTIKQGFIIATIYMCVCVYVLIHAFQKLKILYDICFFSVLTHLHHPLREDVEGTVFNGC